MDLAQFVSDYVAVVEGCPVKPEEVAEAYLEQNWDPAGGEAWSEAVERLVPQIEYYL